MAASGPQRRSLPFLPPPSPPPNRLSTLAVSDESTLLVPYCHRLRGKLALESPAVTSPEELPICSPFSKYSSSVLLDIFSRNVVPWTRRLRRCVALRFLSPQTLLILDILKQQLNRLNVSLFTPSLLFSKVAFFLTPRASLPPRLTYAELHITPQRSYESYGSSQYSSWS